MPPYRYDDICDLCAPGRRRQYPEPERAQHWRKHHPERLTLMLAMLRDQKEGFGWRPMLPTVNDYQCEGICPHCGPASLEDGRLADVYPHAQQDSAQPIDVVYCVHCGDIIRLDCAWHSRPSCSHCDWVTMGRPPSTTRPIGWSRRS